MAGDLAREHFMGPTTMTRRAAGLLGIASAAAARQDGFDLAQPRDGLLAYGKMRADLAGGPAVWHHLIDMHAMVDGQVSRLLFRREGISVHKIKVEEAGLLIHYIASTYTVGDDGLPMARWVNPYTGTAVTFRALAGAKGPMVRVTPAGAANATRSLAPPSAENFAVGRPHIWAGRVSITDDMLVHRTAADQRAVFGGRAGQDAYTATELGAYEADLDDVMDAATTSAPCSRSMVGVVPWGAELGMGDLKGRLMIRHRACKMIALAALPGWLAARAEADTPGIIQGIVLDI
jgi:hypothetical protein